MVVLLLDIYIYIYGCMISFDVRCDLIVSEVVVVVAPVVCDFDDGLLKLEFPFLFAHFGRLWDALGCLWML